MAEMKEDGRNEFAPSSAQLLKYPLAILAYVPRDAAIFAAGAVAGAAAKTVTAPLDRIKLLMQVLFLSFCAFNFYHVFFEVPSRQCCYLVTEKMEFEQLM